MYISGKSKGRFLHTTRRGIHCRQPVGFASIFMPGDVRWYCRVAALLPGGSPDHGHPTLTASACARH